MNQKVVAVYNKFSLKYLAGLQNLISDEKEMINQLSHFFVVLYFNITTL